MLTRNLAIVGSWRRVHASCETSISDCSPEGMAASAVSLVRSTCATPPAETGTDTSERRSLGR